MRSRLKVFWGRMTIFAGPTHKPSRKMVICDLVKPRIENVDGLLEILRQRRADSLLLLSLA